MNTIETMKAIQIQIDELKQQTKEIQAEIDCRPTRDEFESFCNRMGIETKPKPIQITSEFIKQMAEDAEAYITEKDESNAKCEVCWGVGICNHNFWINVSDGRREVFGMCGECDPPEDESE